MSNLKKIPLKWLICLSAVLLLIILAAGLRPRGFRLANNVKWLNGQPGIRFSKYSIAYTIPQDDLTISRKFVPDGFSIEIALKPEKYRERRFEFILALHNGKDSEQLVIGQWRSWFVVMNGDDYAYRRKTNRIAADAAGSGSSPLEAKLVTITSGQEGSRIFFNGKSVAAKKDLRLKIPPGNKVRLIAGNSVYGRHPWQGEIYGLALYNYPLSSQKASLHFNRWSKEQNFSFAGEDNPRALYLFNEKRGTRAHDYSGANRHLEIPSRMQVLKKRILALPRTEFRFDKGFISDALLNFLGFIPFGFILFATFVRFGASFKKHAVLITVAFCFLVSFTMEFLQAWMPSRSSYMLDLALNTLGGLIGAFIYRFSERFKVQG